MFQSLIGILQTNNVSPDEPVEIPFQSLIGILQTYIHYRIRIPSLLFQSLIGILQTLLTNYICLQRKQVSIPHRYSTNL